MSRRVGRGLRLPELLLSWGRLLPLPRQPLLEGHGKWSKMWWSGPVSRWLWWMELPSQRAVKNWRYFFFLFLTMVATTPLFGKPPHTFIAGWTPNPPFSTYLFLFVFHNWFTWPGNGIAITSYSTQNVCIILLQIHLLQYLKSCLCLARRLSSGVPGPDRASSFSCFATGSRSAQTCQMSSTAPQTRPSSPAWRAGSAFRSAWDVTDWPTVETGRTNRAAITSGYGRSENFLGNQY